MHKHIYLPFLLIIATNLFMHWKVFPLEIVGWHTMRQAKTQQNIQLFHRKDLNIFNPQVNVMSHHGDTEICRNEFPLMQWLIALVYKVTGESILVTRICMFLLGSLSILGMFHLIKNLWGDIPSAWAGSWGFCFSPLFYFYTMAPMPDNMALCMGIWSLVFFYRFIKSSKTKHLYFSAFLLALATAVKLPFILYGAAVAIYFLINSIKKNNAYLFKMAIIYGVSMMPALLWYIYVIPTWNDDDVLKGIFENPISANEITDIITYHLAETFPKKLMTTVSLAGVLTGIYFFLKNRAWANIFSKTLMAIGATFLAFWVYEFNMIGKVHDYYLMPLLPLLSISLAYGFNNLWRKGNAARLAAVALVVSLPFVTHDRARKYWDKTRQTFNRDVYLYQDDLKNAVPADAKCIILNDPTQYEFAYLVDKSAFIFRDDNLPGSWVGDLIERYGISYMYSSSRVVESDPLVQQHLDEMMMERGDARVFRLKK